MEGLKLIGLVALLWFSSIGVIVQSQNMDVLDQDPRVLFRRVIETEVVTLGSGTSLIELRLRPEDTTQVLIVDEVGQEVVHGFEEFFADDGQKTLLGGRVVWSSDPGKRYQIYLEPQELYSPSLDSTLLNAETENVIQNYIVVDNKLYDTNFDQVIEPVQDQDSDDLDANSQLIFIQRLVFILFPIAGVIAWIKIKD